MKPFKLSLPIVAVIAALAIILGSVGTATASGLTKGAVKRIAAKVVKKSAPTLSVAHASTADSATNATNAANLNGLPATSYQNSAFTVSLTNVSAVGSFSKTLPTSIPNGNYLVNYYLTGSTSVVTGVYCELYTISTSASLLDSFNADGFNNLFAVNSTKAITVSGPMRFFCEPAAGTMSTPASVTYAPAQISFTRIDSITNTGSARTDAGSGAVAPAGVPHP